MTNKLCIGVCSCNRDRNRGAHDRIRNSWVNDVRDFADVLFFIGGERPDNLQADEVHLDVLDDYRNLPSKVRQMCHWTLSQPYTHLFKTDNDVTVLAEVFRTIEFANIDYMGDFNSNPVTQGYCRGGGYFLSRRAMELVANHEPSSWAEDVSTGDALRDAIRRNELVCQQIPAGAHTPVHESAGRCKTCYRPLGPDDLYCSLHSHTQSIPAHYVAVLVNERQNVRGKHPRWVPPEVASLIVQTGRGERVDEWQYLKEFDRINSKVK